MWRVPLVLARSRSTTWCRVGPVVRYLRRFDDGFARGESVLAAIVLLAMIFVAAAQALLFNIAGHDVAWAHAALDSFSWADEFLQKGTLWLAFLGATITPYILSALALGELIYDKLPQAPWRRS